MTLWPVCIRLLVFVFFRITEELFLVSFLHSHKGLRSSIFEGMLDPSELNWAKFPPRMVLFESARWCHVLEEPSLQIFLALNSSRVPTRAAGRRLHTILLKSSVPCMIKSPTTFRHSHKPLYLYCHFQYSLKHEAFTDSRSWFFLHKTS